MIPPGPAGRRLAALYLAVCAAACGNAGAPPDSPAGPTPDRGPWFTDRAAEAGLAFVHFNGMTGEFHDAEIFAPGVALLDYDTDGDLDVYLVQGGMLDPRKTVEQASVPRPRTPTLCATGCFATT